jgi:hypothetical protein
MNREKFLAYILAIEFPLHTHATFNPSVFTTEFFVKDTDGAKSLKKGLNLSLILNALFTLGIYQIDKTAGLISGAVSVGTYLYFNKLIENKLNQLNAPEKEKPRLSLGQR